MFQSRLTQIAKKSIVLKLISFFLVTLGILGFLFASKGIAQVANKDTMIIPFPNLAKESYTLTPVGEIFKFATCTRKDLTFTISSAMIGPGGGPIPHVHHYTPEWFWTPKGGYELFESEQEFPSVNNPPTAEAAGKTKIYTVQTKPNGIIYGPRFHVHGFTNATNEMLPITFIWMRANDVPDFLPYHDGGIREYFEETGFKIDDLNKLPEITNASRAAFATDAPKYGINQSTFFLQYVKEISDKIPTSLATMKDDQNLNAMIKMIEDFNSGDKSVSCI